MRANLRWLAGFALLLAGNLYIARADEKDQGMVVDKKTKTITIQCQVAPRKLPNLKEVYPIEVIATFPAEGDPKRKIPKAQKAHETVVTYTVLPSDVHKALEGLGLKPGKVAFGEGAKAEGPEVTFSLEIPTEGGGTKKVSLEDVLVDKKTGKKLPKLKWIFTGSAMKQPDPEKDEKVYGADLTGTLISLFPVTADTVFQTNLTLKEEPLIKLETNTKVLPKEGTPVKLIIQAK
ncbi:MAG: YdjY domain-containing protein [Gemmataceae bacterium]